ncbi:hypothetical protein FSP39_018661 [Pinctada imbricata]|uniref:beta-N-acetylhexosaminidase n=1 Tax=Pinctada imbricata TaxID=66713 RepID=A0AA89CB70_PINIB|nr:hypothetical protein FSP39_018661 [Pinctada imbricata]
MDQKSLDEIADTLQIKYGVIDNLIDGKLTYRAHLTLTNTGSVPLTSAGKWKIYFCHIRMVEPATLRDRNEVSLFEYGVCFSHVNGWLFALQPLKDFKTLNKGESLDISFNAQHYSVARTDAMPNWYMEAEGLKPRLVKSTCGEELSYIEPFDTPQKWKRFDYKMDSGVHRKDQYNPFTAQERYEKYNVDDLGKAGLTIIPTPVEIKLPDGEPLCLTEGDWVLYHEKGLEKEANFLKEKLNISMELHVGKSSDKTHIIQLSVGNITVLVDSTDSPESYKLSVLPNIPKVEIQGNTSVGVFYGIQSLLSLCDNNSIPSAVIVDAPRYTYRGMHMDVSRNFHGKDQILKLLDGMAMYKLNKFHFHLTDDEGWRLEIPGLEELTTVGSRRGHDLKERTCILPMLGSGPNFDTSGTGFFSVNDYKEILQYATDRHIEVIPEIDMPGHSHAAIKAMQARYCHYKENGDLKKAEEFLVRQLDTNGHQSVQMFSDNAMDPGMESTYRFVNKVVEEVKKMHKDIAPLRIFHFGGDEVPYEAWEGSDACDALVKSGKVKSHSQLMEYFVTRVSEIVAKHDLGIGAWQDGVIHDEVMLEPVKRSKFPNKEVFVYAWQNVWESGLSGCAYRLANNGYKTVMSQGTHLYFDHPYEPDPEERGLYWAARYISTQKTFSFMPDHIYSNADYKLTGDPITYKDLMKHPEDHEPLKKQENILGMQGQLWTELVRTADQMDAMIFPRLIALAERAWHKASWESVKDEKSQQLLMKADWCKFANTLGYKELRRLDKLGITYHIPPPGAKVEDGMFNMTCAYPGTAMFYSLDGGDTWEQYQKQVEVTPAAKILIHSRDLFSVEDVSYGNDLSKSLLDNTSTLCATQTKSSALIPSHRDSAYDTAIWEDCLSITLDEFYTWETRGRAGPLERPYMTELGSEGLDHWCRVKRRELAAMCPALPLPVLRCVTMKQLVKNLINVMIGIPSDTFLFDTDKREFTIVEGTYVSGLSPESLSSLTQDFLVCGTRYNRLRYFARPPVIDSFYTGGLVFQAFVGALRKVLHHYTGVVLSIPENTKLLGLRFLCHHLFQQMRFLSALCKCEGPMMDTEEQYENFPKGVELLSYIYRETLEAASTDNYPIMLSIMQTSCGPYTLFIQNWLFHGTCQDRHGEFMIEVNDDYLHFKDKNYWAKGYTLATLEADSVPLFLSDYAQDIFVCGKSLNLLKTCCPGHFLCDIRDQDIPRISVTYSEEELGGLTKQCEIYISKMTQIARQLTLSRKALEEKEIQRKQELLNKAKVSAERELKRIHDEMIRKQQLADEKKRKQFKFLKKQMEKDLQRRADEVIAEKEEDKKLVAMVTKQEEALTEQEKELERQAKEEVIAYYQRLTEEAALREQRALWHVRRAKLAEDRRTFLLMDEASWKEEMESNPEGYRLEDLPGWARRAMVEGADSPVEVKDTEEEKLAELPRWARRFMATPSQRQDELDADLPKWARGRFRSDLPMYGLGEQEEGAMSPAGKLSSPLLKRPKTPNVKTGIRLSSTHSADTESEESPTKPSIHTYQHAHSSVQSEETQAKPHIRVSSDQNVSKETEGEISTKPSVKVSDHMSATTETKEREHKPHIKTVPDVNALKETMETRELNVPKLKGRSDLHATTESKPSEWKIKKRNLFGHVSQLSKAETVISAPKLKRPEQIYAALESDYKDFGIKPRIKMNKKMSATKESEEIQTKSKIKFSEKMHATKESEFVDFDQMRLEKFRQQNIAGHASDSTIQRLLYGIGLEKAENIPTGEQVEPVRFIDAQLEVFRYQDQFDMFDKLPDVDLLRGIVPMVYGGLGDYGISQRSDIEMCQYLPLDGVLKRSVTTPILSQVRLVNEAVLDYFFVDLKVIEHFRALRRYLFMGDGDFAQILSDIILEKFASNPRPYEMLNPVFLNGALNRAVKSSMHAEDPLADNLSFVLKYKPTVLQQTGVCREILTRLVKWPLNIVITEEAISSYNKVFTFMMQLKRTVWVLKDIWHRLKRDALIHKAGNSSQFRQLHIYRQEMQHFVRVMQEYIASQIIHVSWTEFQDALNKDVHNLDDLHRVHTQYLDMAIFRCLLNKKAQKVMKIIQDIISLILKFCAQLVNAVWCRDPDSGQMTHSNFSLMVQSYRHFKEYSGFLFKSKS